MTADATDYIAADGDWVVPRSWSRLRSWEQLERWRDQRPGLVVILDEPTESRFHDPWCDDAARRHFETKQRNGWTTGAYFWIEDPAQAVGYATPCGNCGGRPSETGEAA
jgi:hypothetical protein